MIRIEILLPAALAALSLTGCIGDPEAPDLDAPRALWGRMEPVSYGYTVRHTCFCVGGPVYVVADRDSVLTAKMEGPAPGDTLTDVPSPQDYSMEALFDEVEERLQRRHDSHRVSFDPAYGFPADIYIDFEKGVADEEYGLVITDFRPLNPLPAKSGAMRPGAGPGPALP